MIRVRLISGFCLAVIVTPILAWAGDEVTRTTRVIRGNDTLESVFSRGGRVIGQQLESDKGPSQYTGDKLQGPVHFVDEYRLTHGVENYRDGLKHGVVIEYYSDDRVRSESYYSMGRLMSIKEYDSKGRLRFEVNYEDALENFDKHETGEGKVYYPNGKVKFEWSHTRSKSSGFKKTYNQEGVLVYAAYYDRDGRLIREEKP